MVPARLLDIFAAVMLLVAAVSAVRLVAARPWRREAAEADIDAAHLLMGIAMAGMLAASLTTLPGGAWEVVFGVFTAWFAWRVGREARGHGARSVAGGHRTPHLVHSAAMLYMFAALTAPMTASGGMGGMGGSSGGMGTLRLPTLALVFALLLVGYAVWDLDRLGGPAVDGHSHPARARVTLGRGTLGGAQALAAAGSPTAATFPAATADPPAAATSGTVTGRPVTAGAPATAAQPYPAGATRVTGTGSAAARALVLAPGLAAVCQIAMGVTMAFMLIILI